MNNPTDRGKLFKIIKLLYELMSLPFSEEAEPMDVDHYRRGTGTKSKGRRADFPNRLCKRNQGRERTGRKTARKETVYPGVAQSRKGTGGAGKNSQNKKSRLEVRA